MESTRNRKMNEWLDMFGLESIWNDPDWPTYKEKQKEKIEEKEIIDNESYYLYNKLKGI